MENNQCDCPFAPSCHSARQWLRVKFREDGYEQTIQDCDFYKVKERFKSHPEDFIVDGCLLDGE